MASGQKPSKTLARLDRSQRDGAIVSCHRSLGHGKWGGRHRVEAFDGVVLNRGSEWVLFAVLPEGGYPDGYSVVRFRDITKVSLNPVFQEFVESRDPWPLPDPAYPLALSETAGLVQSVVKNTSVYELYEEKQRPGSLWICSPRQWRKRSVWVCTIEPDGTWDAMWTKTRFKDVTRIDFMGDYCSAMEPLAGPDPQAHGAMLAEKEQ